MPREGYRDALDALRGDVRAMGDCALSRLDRGLTALDAHDEDLAREVVDDDDVARHYRAIESDCIDLFALQQPVASDLRFVASSYKIATDVKRVGDLAENFGTYALASARDVDDVIDVAEIGEAVYEMVDDAIGAYVDGDAAACREIAARDDRVDTLCQAASERVVRDLIEREVPDGDAWELERLMDDVSRLLLTIRDLERVGDHAVNVAARTLYVVEGDRSLLY